MASTSPDVVLTPAPINTVQARPISVSVPESTAPTQASETKASETTESDAATAVPATPLAEPNKGGPLTSSPSQSNKNETAVRIILLLTATGVRHPFTINVRYLQRHKIQAADNDPWNIKVYDVKSLIWHEWLADWEVRPSSPASIRLIFMGGLLDDKTALKDCRLNKSESNVVHMMIRPQDLNDEEEVKGKEQNAGAERQGERSRCCVIL